MYTILIVEDDPSILELIQMNLLIAGYRCETASDGSAALTMVQARSYDLALLDIMLPEIDGFSLLPRIRERGVPVIFISAKNDITSRVQGLRLGAEDYLVKPFDILELLVRMEKVLERTHPHTPQILQIAGVTVNEAERTVLVEGRSVQLKPMEYSLMLLLMKHPGMVFSREQLLQEVWGDRFFGETRTVDSHIAILRKKLNWSKNIVTVHRIGYKLEVNP